MNGDPTLELPVATSQFAVVIPACNPADDFVDQVGELRARGFPAIIVTNDGSRPGCLPVFDRVAKIPGAVVLHHAVNCGQGRALKTGFNYFLLNYPTLRGVVTVDCDGQHHPDDAVKVAQTLAKHPDKLALGARYFAEGVPWKSLAGNLISRWLFTAMAGGHISDTQSGLRGIARKDMPDMITLAGEGFEYNMNMLVSAHAAGLPVIEQSIRTIYIEGNKSTHFKPVRDSMRVTFVLLRFYLSSLTAAAADLVVFSILYHFTGQLLRSMMIARALAGGLVNFGINRGFVFHSRSAWLGPLLKFCMLLAFSGLVSYASVRALSQWSGWNVVLCKVLVEVPLSLFNFAIQRTFVFRPDQAGGSERMS